MNNKNEKSMKKLFVYILATLLVLPLASNAQDAKDLQKERKEIRKASMEELNEKVSKDAKKEAKRLKKEGWITTPGTLPLEKQLNTSYLMQMERDNSMYPMYIMAEAMSVGENYDAAKMQASELAKLQLAGKMQTEITALIESSIGNQQLSKDEASSLTQTVNASKGLISQKIGRVIVVVECYRVKANQNKEVLVRIAYNSNMAKAAAKQAIQEELKDKNEELHNKLDEVLGW